MQQRTGFMKLTLLGTLALAAALSQTAALAQPATPLPARMHFVTSVEGITEYRLDNGLRVLVFPDTSKSTITVNVTYLVGSRQEGSGERGMAHLLEHMVFKGSLGHTNVNLELSAHGAQWNGTTAADRTNYFETLQASDENLKWALDLESDRMVNSFIKKEALDTEMTVVRNEFESGENDPFRVLMERTMAAAYLWHPYGRAVIGNRSDIENVPIDKLKAFYQKFYQPDNAVLTIAGKVDESKLLPLIATYFGQIPKPERKLEETYTGEPTQDGEREVTVRRVGDNQGVFSAYHVPAASDKDFAVVQVITNLLSDNPSGRLYKALVDNKKASQVMGFDKQSREPGLACFVVFLSKQDSIDDARNILEATVETLANEPPSKEEVDRSKTRLLKNLDLQLRNSERIGLFMSEWAATGDWRLLYLYRDRLKEVTPDDVKRVASNYLKSSNRTVGEFIPDANPDRAEIPRRVDVEALVKDYKGEALMSEGEIFDSSPANIEARVKRMHFPNDMRVSLLSKKTRGSAVRAIVSLHYGTVSSLMGQGMPGSMSVETLIRGTKEHNRQQIQDEFDRMKATVNIRGGADGLTVNIETIRDSLPAVLKLVAEVLREPAFPEQEFENIRKHRLTDAEYDKSEPQDLASTGIQRLLYPFPRGDVRSAMTADEEIEDLNKVKLDEARSFYAKFVSASHGEVAIVGDFDADAAASQLKDLFGAWKTSAPYERILYSYRKIDPADKSIETPDKANAVFKAGLRLPMQDDDADYPAMVLGNYMMGAGPLSSRLGVRVRQNEGLSYDIRSQFIVAAQEQNASFRVSAIAAPQNVAKVQAAVLDEISRALKDGFTAEELARAKSGWLQGRQVNRAEDATLVGSLALHDYNDRTLAWDADLEKKVRNLTAEQINQALKTHIKPEDMSFVKAGDWKKGTEATKK
jgi:zinc protease